MRITIEPASGKNRGIEVRIEDDGAGFKRIEDIWTIYSSGKRDDPTKRGRLGRGLKELISVAAEADVFTAGKNVQFQWDGKTMNRHSRSCETVGTTIVARVPSWKKSEIDQIAQYLSLFIPPDGTLMTVNGVPNARPVIEHAVPANLKTNAYNEDGVPRETWRDTKIHLFHGDRGKWIYEMGIPVEEINDEDGFEWSMDIQQRTPIRPERDMLPRYYEADLYAHVANHLITALLTAELADLWMDQAIAHHSFDKDKHGKTYVERRFGQNAARAIVNDPHDRTSAAINDGISVVRTQHLTNAVRDIVSKYMPTTADLYPVKCAEARMIPVAEWTDAEKHFLSFSQWLAVRLQLQKPTMYLMDAPQSNCEADTREGLMIRVNRTGVGSTFFTLPSISNWIPLIVHELAHRAGNGQDATFWRQVERLHGAAAQVLVDEKDTLRQFGLGRFV